MLFVIEVFALVPFSMLTIGMFMYNTRVLLFADSETGIITGAVGISVALFGIGFSNFPARYGIKCSILCASVLSLIYYILMYVDLNRYVQIGLGISIIVPSVSLNFISLKLGIKQYTYQENRSVGYSIFFIIFFIGGGLASLILDGILTAYPNDYEAFHVVFIVSGAFSICLFSLTLFLRNLDIEESGENDLKFQHEQTGWEYTKEVLVTARFWKFALVVILLSVVKSVFFHVSSTLPIYMDRSIGSRAHFSYIMMVHQFVLMIFLPLLTGLIRYFDFYTLLNIGSLITIISPMFLLLGNNYYTLAAFVAVMSIGEAIYAPRIVDYTIQMAPKGKESIYLAMANVPNSLSLTIAGISSGFLMESFCPQSGEQHCTYVWFLISAFCVIPYLIFAFGRRFLEEKDNKD